MNQKRPPLSPARAAALAQASARARAMLGPRGKAHDYGRGTLKPVEREAARIAARLEWQSLVDDRSTRAGHRRRAIIRILTRQRYAIGVIDGQKLCVRGWGDSWEEALAMAALNNGYSMSNNVWSAE